MKMLNVRVLFLSLFALLFLAAPAAATDYLATAGQAIVDPDPAGTGSYPAYMQDDGILIDAKANRSYVCQGIPAASDSAFYFNRMVVGQNGDAPQTITARAIGDMNPVITEPDNANGRTRISFIPTQDNRFKITVASAKAGGEVVRVVCRETTLCGGFNTNGTRFVFLTFRNDTNKAINFQGSFVTFDGDEGSFDDLTVPARRRRDASLHGLLENLLGDNTRTFGGMLIAHDGTDPEVCVSRYATRDDEGDLESGSFRLRGTHCLRRCAVEGR